MGLDTANWLTPKEVAEMLQYNSTSTVCLLIAKGLLRAVNRSAGVKPSWLIDPASVEAFIQSRLTGPVIERPLPLPNGVKRIV